MRFIYSALFAIGLLTALPLVLLEDERAVWAQTTTDQQMVEANQLNQQGAEQFRNSEYQGSLQSHQAALEIYRTLGDYNGESAALAGIGWAYQALGQFEKAFNAAQQSLDIINNKNLNSYRKVHVLNLLAYIQLQLGQYQESIRLNQQGLEILGQGNHSRSYAATIALADIGLAYSLLNNHQQALNYAQQALFLIANNPYAGDPLIGAWILNDIGNSYRQLERYEEAVEYHQQAIEVAQSINNKMVEADASNDLGRTYQKLEQYPQALNMYQQALSSARSSGYLPGEARSLRNIGFLASQQNQPQIAIVFLKQSVNVYERIRSNISGLSTDIRQSYTETVADTYRKLADLLLQQNRILEAQRVLDLLKVQELDEYLRNVRGNEQTASGVEYWQPEQRILDLYAQVIAEGIELLQLEEKDRTTGLTPAEEQRYDQLLPRQTEILANFDRFKELPTVQAALQQLRQSTEGQNVELADFNALQRDLGELQQDAVLLYPLILEDRLELVLVTPYSPPIRRPVPVNSTDLNRAIVELGQALKNPAIDARPAAQQLYEWLIQPLEAELKAANARTILYAPDGPLRYIPLAALYDGQSWLTQRFAFSQITAASLTRFTARPDLNLRVLAGACAECSFDFTVGNQQFQFNDLPYTAEEVKNLSALIPGTSSLLNQAFSPAEVVNDLRRYSVIHLATHAAFVQQNGDQSFIVFGNGQRVTLGEIEQNWNLRNIDLIVLSACETAVGETELGSGVEVLGFGYQMQQAGARAAIASLWAVNDNSTQVLMNAFYAGLKQGLSKSEALQTAQRTLLEGQTTGATASSRSDVEPRLDGSVAVVPQSGVVSRSYTHPYYWAPFILIGNGL